MKQIRLLENPVRHYAWGSRTFLARLQGRPAPTAEPEAELWIGAHPAAPSRVRVEAGSVPLDEWISREPASVLGPGGGAALPFMAKLLAAARPLSLQAHPDAEQARAGFEREEAAGIPLDSPERCYRDPAAKPELVCALSPFRALIGFREPRTILERATQLRAPRLEAAFALLREQPNVGGWRRAFSDLQQLEPPAASALVGEVHAAAEAAGPRAPWLDWLVRLAAEHPDDAGALAPLYLHVLELAPGQAASLPPRVLHTYLEGNALEVMGSSDNVVRGGLTRKHVDVDGLVRVLDFAPWAPQPLDAQPAGEVERVYAAPPGPFRLSVLALEDGRTFEAAARQGVEVLVCTEGRAVIAVPGFPDVALAAGHAALVPAACAGYRIAGVGCVFRIGPAPSA